MKILVVCGMSDDKVRANLLPLQELDIVENIFLVRRLPLKTKKTKSYSTPTFLKWSLILSELYRFFALIYICVREKPDLLYAIYFVPHGIYAALAGFLFGIPVIQELIGTDRPKVAKSRLLQGWLKKAARIGVRGALSTEQLVSLGIPREKIFVPTAVNVLDFSLFSPKSSTKLYDLIYCGRMDKNKQVDLMINAIALVRQKLPEIRVALVGDGPERKNLESLCRQLNLENVIVFTGNLSYQQLPKLLNQSRIFMMASVFEGLPVAMIEALSCCLPVIVPDIGDISDVAADGFNAVLVKTNEVSDYAKALSELLTNQSLYNKLAEGACKTREHFVENFSLEKTKKIWEEIITSIS